MTRFILSLLAAAALTLSQAHALTVKISGSGTPQVNIESELKKVGPQVYIPANDQTDQDALDTLSRLYPTAPNGQQIPRGNWAANNGIAYASADGKIDVLKILKNGGTAFIVRDKDGNPLVNLTPGSVRVAGLQNGRLKQFLLQDGNKGAISLGFSVLVDNSGSMADVIDKVKTQATAFVSSMGKRVICQLSRFDEKRKVLTQGFQTCKETKKAIPQIKGNGPSTNLVAAIHEEMSDLDQQNVDFKALLVLSDGMETGDGKAASILARKNFPIYSYWVGNKKADTILKPISNAFFPDLKNGSKVLERMLMTVSKTYNGIKVIHVR